MNAGKAIAVAAVLVLALAGCAGEPDNHGNTRPGDVWAHQVDLPDGRRVWCIWEKEGYAGGPSCDWANAK